MNRRIGLIWGLVTLGVAAVVGGIAYWAGTMVTTGGRVVAGPYPYYYGFHFFPFFGLFWLLLIGFLLFALFRGFGRGRWGYGGGPWMHGGPYGLSEWHRQAHGETPSGSTGSSTQSGGPTGSGTSTGAPGQGSGPAA